MNISIAVSPCLSLLCTVVLTVPVNRAAAADCSPIPGSPVSFWAGEGDALDSADGNHGTSREGVSYDAGQVGQSFVFDGTREARVEFPDSPNLLFEGSFSIEAWVQTTLGSGPNVAADIVRKRLREFPQRDLDIVLGIVDGAVRFAAVDDNNNNNLPAGIQGPMINDGLWHHVAGVRDAGAGETRLYVDGVLAARIADQLTTFTDSSVQPWNIGNNPSFNQFPWDGQIDEIGIFDRALGDREVSLVFEAGSEGRCGLVILKSGFE